MTFQISPLRSTVSLVFAAALLGVGCAGESADPPTDTATRLVAGTRETGSITDGAGPRERLAGLYELVSIGGLSPAEFARRNKRAVPLVTQLLQLGGDGGLINTRVAHVKVAGRRALETTVDSGRYTWSRDDGLQLIVRGISTPFSVRDDGQIEACGIPPLLGGTMPCWPHRFRRVVSSR